MSDIYTGGKHFSVSRKDISNSCKEYEVTMDVSSAKTDSPREVLDIFLDWLDSHASAADSEELLTSDDRFELYDALIGFEDNPTYICKEGLPFGIEENIEIGFPRYKVTLASFPARTKFKRLLLGHHYSAKELGFDDREDME